MLIIFSLITGIIWSNKLADGVWDFSTPYKRPWNQSRSPRQFRIKCFSNLCFLTIEGIPAQKHLLLNDQYMRVFDAIPV